MGWILSANLTTSHLLFLFLTVLSSSSSKFISGCPSVPASSTAVFLCVSWTYLLCLLTLLSTPALTPPYSSSLFLLSLLSILSILTLFCSPFPLSTLSLPHPLHSFLLLLFSIPFLHSFSYSSPSSSFLNSNLISFLGRTVKVTILAKQCVYNTARWEI